MNLNELRDTAYQCACEHGFHENEYHNNHWFMLTIGEVAEMVEADRKGLYPYMDAFQKCDIVNDEEFKKNFERCIKNTVYDEMADIVIRLLDFAGLRKIDIKSNYKWCTESIRQFFDKFNDRVSTIPMLGYEMVGILADSTNIESTSVLAIAAIMEYANRKSINLEWYIQQKMRYNSLRPYKNGKKY